MIFINPTVCIHKEGIMIQIFRNENYLDILNNNRERFYGEKLLVYNEETRQTFLNNNYRNNQIEVVGSVRFDYIHSLLNQKIDQNKIVLFHQI